MDLLRMMFAAKLAAAPVPEAHTCLASWYGAEVRGRTASGARWRPGGLSLASRTLPLGARVHVCHRGRCAPAVVNDRGPVVRGRCVDLSRGLAQRIGIRGLGMVQIVRR